MSKYNQELHSNYQKAIQAFLNVYPGKTDKMSMLIDSYCRTCALYLWNTFGVDLSVCTDGINVLYAEDKYKRAYTTTQVASALNKLAQKQYTLPVPEFFENIVAQDRIDGTNYMVAVQPLHTLPVIASLHLFTKNRGCFLRDT